MGKYEASGNSEAAAFNKRKPKTSRVRSSKSGNKPDGKRRKRRLILPVILTVLLATGMIAYLSTLETPGIAGDVPKVEPPDTPSISGPGSSAQPGTSDPKTDRNYREKGKFYNILLVGTNDGYNTDTIMLCSVDVVNNKVNIASIPRDTMIDTDAKIKRINGAYGRVGIRDEDGGREGLCEEVETITGVPVDYYAVVNIKSFTKIVDTIGGVDFYVPYNMYHVDLDPSMSINLQKGQQTLTGKKALQMMRYRGTNQNDFGRMQLQRDFLLATAKQVLQKFDATKIIEIIGVINESTKTDMPLNNMVWFYENVVKKLDLDKDIEFMQFPVEGTGKYNKQDYVYLDPAGVLEMVNEKFNPYAGERTEKDIKIIHLEN